MLLTATNVNEFGANNKDILIDSDTQKHLCA